MKKRLLTVLLAVCLVVALGTVTAMADDAVVAQIGDTTYDTLSSAFANAVDGSEIVLQSDVTGCGRLSLTDGRSIVVNLNGHNIGFAANGYFYVHHGSLTLTGTGVVKEEHPYYAPVLVEGAETDLGNNYAVVNVGENVTLEGWSGVFIDYVGTSSGKNHSYGVNVTVNGTINSVLDTSNAAGHGVYINGTIQDIEGSVPVIALGETSSITSQGNGIYAAGYAIWTLAGDVTAPNALSIKSGTFTINSGNYTSTGEFAEPATPNGNGSEDTGAALSITSNKAYAGKTDVTVNGGTFVSQNGYAVYEGIAYSSTSGPAAEASYASIQINNGVFKAAEDKDAVSIEKAENKKVISGGTFTSGNATSNVSKYYIAGAALTQDENGTIVEDTGKNIVARVDGIGFTDLASAIAAADDGDTVTLLEGVKIDTSLELKDGITLDLGGNTLTSTDDYTVVCATGASAEVKNGNLTGGTDSTVYNNGTALTLNGVNITYSGSRCAIQNNTGSLTLVDCTVNGGSGGGIWDFGTKSSVKLTSSTVTGGYFAVYHNGSTAGFTLNAENSTLIGDSEDACAIYVSGSATNTAESAHGMNNIKLTNCTVTGPTGIEGKYTNMVLTNCDITATAEPDFEQNNNGTTALGFAVVSTDNSMEPNSPAPESDITINGGAYDGIVGLGQYEDIDKYEGFQESDYTVTGGSFANPLPSEYRGVGLNAELYSRSNSDTPYSYYSTVGEAMDAAQPGDIVTDLSKVTGDTRYNVTFNYGNNDSETVSVSAGATITFTAPTRSGYEFRGWRDGSGELHKAGETVTVNSDMTFSAVWGAMNIPDTYDIEIADTANGEVDTSLSNASAGSTITITATPDSGYSVASVTVTGPDGRVDVVRVNATTYTFKMPAGDVTVRVTFTDSDALPFTDVRAGQWFYDAVAYVYTNGMMEGDSATTFNPDGTMTRAMFWAVLGRIDGATITGTNWADQAREWAMAEGVSDGTDPNGLVTREQMVTMLWRYAGEPESSASLSAYTDAESVSDWAETAMRWAIDEGIITGMTDTTLVPQGTATRAQCAAIFMRFDQM